MKTYTRQELFETFSYLTVTLVYHLIQMGKITKAKKNAYEVDDDFLQTFDYETFWKQRKEEARKKRSISQSKFQQSRSKEEKEKFRQNCSKAVTKVWANYSKEDKDARCAISREAISKAMKTNEARQHCREAQLDWQSRAPKEWNERRIAKIKNTMHKTYTPKKREEISKARKEAYIQYNGAIQEKCNATKRKNGTFTTSKDEQRFLQELIGLGLVLNDTLIKEKYYPNTHKRCDFYIVPLDLYVELQYSQYHMHEPFNENNKEHQQILQKLKDRSSALHSKPNARRHNQYDKMIEVWTVRDIEKITYAKELNLNLVLIYTYEQEQEFLLGIKKLLS